VLVDWNQ
jgi:DNA replication licensing factor MCM6